MAIAPGLLQFGEWRPDIASINSNVSSLVQNAVPRADGYGPFQDWVSFTQPLAAGNDSYTKVLLHFDGADASTTATDSNAGGSAHTWTAHGDAQIDTAQYKLGGSSSLYDGTGDYFDTPDHADFTLGSGDFTADFWFKCNVASGSIGRLCGQNDNAGTASTRSFIVAKTAGDVIQATACIGSSSFTVTSTTQFTNAVNTGWHHCAFVRTGNTLKLFIDGIQEGGNVSISGTINDSSNKFAVGTTGEQTTNPWNGWIDEFRLSVGIARWTAAFTPPQKNYDTAANGQCRGAFFARNSDGSITIFAATATRIFKLNNTNFDWIDVSLSGLAYSSVTAGANWQFVQFNKNVIAVQVSVPPQVFDLSSSTNFGNLGGSPPQAAGVIVIGRFVVLFGISSQAYRVQWSDLNGITTWDNVTGQSNFQDLSDGGRVIGGAGGDQFGVIFQETSIRSVIYAPGSSFIFEILRISSNDGIISPGFQGAMSQAAISAGDVIFFISPQGFKRIVPGGYPEPIGKEKFDRTFFDDLDTANMQFLVAATDPNTTQVYWSYKSIAGQASAFDKILVYDRALNKATFISKTGEYLCGIARPGITLEGLDTISSSVDALPFSLDSFSVSASPEIAMFDSNHKAGFFEGSNLEAILETPDQDAFGRRIFISDVRPMTDCSTAAVSIGCRETAQSSVTYTAETPMDDIGNCPIDGGGIDTRYAKVRVRIPAGAVWTYATGVEPNFRLTGPR